MAMGKSKQYPVPDQLGAVLGPNVLFEGFGGKGAVQIPGWPTYLIAVAWRSLSRACRTPTSPVADLLLSQPSGFSSSQLDGGLLSFQPPLQTACTELKKGNTDDRIGNLILNTTPATQCRQILLGLTGPKD